MPRSRSLALLRRLAAAALAAGAATAQTTPATVDFVRDVRPILSDRCFRCHGPDAAHRKGGLRLDRRDVAVAELPSGRTAIVPGAPDASELVRRITAADPDERMPPADSGLVLGAAEIATLRRWVADGAEYAVHWSFAPLPHAVPVPIVPGAAPQPDNPIDAFVLARLAAEGLAPAPPADAATFLRRLSLTLTGLPPSAEELDAFEADDGAAATARAVDRLLASPRYGERMAVDWLDVARYADTFGYQNDVERPVWPWRDWVVRAFAEGMPYDRFATLQIAGDLVPHAGRDDVLATAFQRLHRMTNEGGSVEEEMRLESVADRTETFATAFLGLTLGCARCHDHKFDPIPQRDYYALSAFFDDIDESGLYSHFTNATPTPALSLPTDEQSQQEDAAAERVRELEASLATLAGEREAAFAAWREAGGAVAPRDPIGHYAFDAIDGDALRNEVAGAAAGQVGDGPQLVDGRHGEALRFDGENRAKLPKVADFDQHQPFSLAFWLRVPERYGRAVVLHRSMAWTDAGSRGYELLVEDGALSFALVHFWPGNALRVRADEPLPVDRWTHVALTYDGSSRASGAAIWIDGQRANRHVVRDALTRTITGGGADALTLAQRFRDRGLEGGAIDDLYVFDRELTDAEVAQLAGAAPPADTAAARAFYLRNVDGPYRARLDELRDARRALGAVRDAEAEIMVMRDLPEPRPTFVRPRGAYDQEGERVDADTPTCLPPLPHDGPHDAPRDGPPDRLALARWLCAPDHPLTARVAVNRIWQLHFGRGLVETAEDFGSQGTPPTHPELLDWLARRFVDSGWDVKALHRLIVTSQTFRRSSAVDAALRERDPDNRLLARGPRFPLAAEVLRDQALWASGLFVEELGGPPVRPYQPPGLWEEKSGVAYQQSTGDGLWRRSLYTFWKRTSPPPAMAIFDAPGREVCAARRHRTTTPLQALVLLDDPQHVEAARAHAEQLVAAGGDDAGRLAAAFRRWTSRRPTDREAAVLAAALAEQRASFRAAPDRAAALVAVGERPPAPGLDATEVAAWTLVVATIANFDHVLTQR